MTMAPIHMTNRQTPSMTLAPEPEAAIGRTVELGDRLHVDLSPSGEIVGVEILPPVSPVRA